MKSRNYLDLITPPPADFGNVYNRRPPCCGGGPDAVDSPPPPIAPYRADSLEGTEQAISTSSRRKGLRKTILEKAKREQQPSTLGNASPANTLGTSAVVGAAPTTLASAAR